jgi:hypothetical protein
MWMLPPSASCVARRAGLCAAPTTLAIPLIDRGAWLWLAGAAWLLATFKMGVDNVLSVTRRHRRRVRWGACGHVGGRLLSRARLAPGRLLPHPHPPRVASAGFSTESAFLGDVRPRVQVPPEQWVYVIIRS